MAVPFSEWTRQEKDEFGQKKMEEMRVRNEVLKQRYAEVELDRLNAEAKNSAVTKQISCKDKKSSEHRVDDVPRQREWDKGKHSMDDGDWSCQRYDENHKSTWRSFPDKALKKERHRENHYKYSKREGDADPSKYTGSGRNRYFNSRNQGNTFYGRNNNFSNLQESASWSNAKNSKCDYHKSDKTSKVASIIRDAGIHEVKNIKSENDPMWLGEETTDSEHKQIRIEKWVKSLNSESSWDSEDINQPEKQPEFDLPHKDTKTEENESKKYHRNEERYENSKSNDAIRKPSGFKGSFQQKHDGNKYDSVDEELDNTEKKPEKPLKTNTLTASDGLWEDVEDDGDILFVDLEESLSNDYQDFRKSETTKEEDVANEHAHVSNRYKIKETALRSSCNYQNVESDTKWKSSKSNFEESNENYKVSSKPLNFANKFKTGSSSCNKILPSQKLYTSQYGKGPQSGNLQTPKKLQVNSVTGQWDVVNTSKNEKCDIGRNRALELDQKVDQKNYVSKYDSWADAVDNDMKWNLDEDLIDEKKENSPCNQKKETTTSSVGKEKTLSSDGWANDPDNDMKWNLNEEDGMI